MFVPFGACFVSQTPCQPACERNDKPKRQQSKVFQLNRRDPDPERQSKIDGRLSGGCRMLISAADSTGERMAGWWGRQGLFSSICLRHRNGLSAAESG